MAFLIQQFGGGGGGGLPAFLGPTLQRGHGIGGIFKGLARSFAPVLKRGITAVGKRALKTGMDALK